jgi:hypothetical protein
METRSTHTDHRAEHTTAVAVRGVAAPEPRTLEELDDDDVRRLTEFLLTSQSPRPFYAFAVVVTLVHAIADHPLLTWMSVSLLALPGFLLTGWWLSHRRYSAFLRDELHLDAANARAMHIFAMREARISFGSTSEEQLAHTRSLIGKARARRDGTG